MLWPNGMLEYHTRCSAGSKLPSGRAFLIPPTPEGWGSSSSQWNKWRKDYRFEIFRVDISLSWPEHLDFSCSEEVTVESKNRETAKRPRRELYLPFFLATRGRWDDSAQIHGSNSWRQYPCGMRREPTAPRFLRTEVVAWHGCHPRWGQEKKHESMDIGRQALSDWICQWSPE